jgi:hypothetical protein
MNLHKLQEMVLDQHQSHNSIPALQKFAVTYLLTRDPEDIQRPIDEIEDSKTIVGQPHWREKLNHNPEYLRTVADDDHRFRPYTASSML